MFRFQPVMSTPVIIIWATPTVYNISPLRTLTQSISTNVIGIISRSCIQIIQSMVHNYDSFELQAGFYHLMYIKLEALNGTIYCEKSIRVHMIVYNSMQVFYHLMYIKLEALNGTIYCEKSIRVHMIVYNSMQVFYHLMYIKLEALNGYHILWEEYKSTYDSLELHAGFLSFDVH